MRLFLNKKQVRTFCPNLFRLFVNCSLCYFICPYRWFTTTNIVKNALVILGFDMAILFTKTVLDTLNKVKVAYTSNNLIANVE